MKHSLRNKSILPSTFGAKHRLLPINDKTSVTDEQARRHYHIKDKADSAGNQNGPRKKAYKLESLIDYVGNSLFESSDLFASKGEMVEFFQKNNQGVLETITQVVMAWERTVQVDKRNLVDPYGLWPCTDRHRFAHFVKNQSEILSDINWGCLDHDSVSLINIFDGIISVIVSRRRIGNDEFSAEDHPEVQEEIDSIVIWVADQFGFGVASILENNAEINSGLLEPNPMKASAFMLDDWIENGDLDEGWLHDVLLRCEEEIALGNERKLKQVEWESLRRIVVDFLDDDVTDEAEQT